MKTMILFLTLSTFFSGNLFSKERVLLVFNTPKSVSSSAGFNGQGSLATTADFMLWGIDLGKKSMPEKLQNQVDFIRVDIDASLEGTTKKLKSAIKKHRPIAVIGAITSNVAFFIKSVTEPLKVPFITPFATHPKVTKDSLYTFRMCFDDSYQAKTLAKFVKEDQKKKRGIIIFNRTQSYSIGFKKIFSENFKKLGGTIVEEFAVSGEADIDQEFIDKLKKKDNDFLLIPAYQFESAAIISKLIKQLPESMAYFGGDSWGGGRIFNKMFEDNPKTFNGHYVQHWSGEEKTKANKEFFAIQKQHQAKVFKGTAMNAPVAIGYDTSRFLLKAIQNKKKDEELRQSLKRVTLDGATGFLSLKKSNTPDKGLFIYKITNQSESFYRKFK